MSITAIIAAFVGGYFAHAGAEHRRARLDHQVLALLDLRGPLYGLDLVKEGAGRRGTIYIRLRRLEDEGLLASLEEPGDVERGYLPRRVYALTDAGSAALLVERARRGAGGLRRPRVAAPPAADAPDRPAAHLLRRQRADRQCHQRVVHLGARRGRPLQARRHRGRRRRRGPGGPRPMRRLLLALALLPACTIAGGESCSDTGCPAGERCEAGRCVPAVPAPPICPPVGLPFHPGRWP